MVSRENIKYYVFIAFLTIVIYKVVDSPDKLLNNIKGLFVILSPFFIGILFSLLINPIIVFIESKIKIKRIFSLLASYLVLTSLFLVLGKIITPYIINTLETLSTEIPYYIGTLDTLFGKNTSGVNIFDFFIYRFQNALNIFLDDISNISSTASNDILNYVANITSLLFNIFMGVILSFYILYDKEKILFWCDKLIHAVTTKKKASYIINFLKTSNYIFYHYIVGRVIDSLIIGILAFLGFKFLVRIENSIFLSFIVFITNIIPYFGPFIGAILPILMTLIYSPIKAFWVLIFIIVLQQLDGNIIGPKIMGDQVGVSPLLIICAVLIGGELFGLLGVFLSVPFLALIKILLCEYIQRKTDFKNSK